MKKKIISSILSLAMLLSLLPVSAFAAGETLPTTTRYPGVIAANLGEGENETANLVSEGYSVTLNGIVSEDEENGTIIVPVKLTAKDVVPHENAEGDTACWIGIGIEQQEGLTTTYALRYSGKTWRTDFSDVAFGTTGVIVNHQNGTDNATKDKTYDTFYFDVEKATSAGIAGAWIAAKYTTGSDASSSIIVVYRITFDVTPETTEKINAVGFRDLLSEARSDSGISDADRHTMWFELGGLYTESFWYTLKVTDADSTTKYLTCNENDQNPDATISGVVDKRQPTSAQSSMKLGVTLNPTNRDHKGAYVYTSDDDKSSYTTKSGTYTVELYRGTSETDASLVKVDTKAIKLAKLTVKVEGQNDVVYFVDTAASLADQGITIATPDDKVDGSVFKSWKVNGTTGAVPATITADTTLEAEFASPITVTFNANYAGADALGPLKVASGSAVTAPTPTRTGYSLKGWGTSATATTPVNLENGFTEDTTLYAIWEPITIVNATLMDSAGTNKVTTATVTVGEANNEGKADIIIGGVLPAAGTFKLAYTDSNEGTGTAEITVTKNATSGKPEMASVEVKNGLGVVYTVKLDPAAELLAGNVLAPVAGEPKVETNALSTSATDTQKTALVAELNKISGTVAPDAGTTNDVSNALAEATKEINSNDGEKAGELLSSIPSSVVNKSDYNAVQAVTYLEVTAKNYVPASAAPNAPAASITLEITPKIKYQAVKVNGGVVDTSVTPVDVGAPANDTLPTDAESVGSVEITFTVPAGFISAVGNPPVYVAHKGYIYTADWETDHYKFTNPHGFSKFVIYAENPAEAKISTTEYATLQDAVKAVTENGTIELLKNPATKTITDVGVTFKLQVANVNAEWLTAITATAVSGKTVTKGTATSDGTNTTVTFTVADDVTPSTPSTPSGGGGGVSSNVTIDRPTNGKVSITPTAPSKGATVTVNLTPDTGYQVGTVTVTDKDGNAVELTKVNDTQYTFVMPDGKVTVKATFTQVEAPSDTGFTDVAADAYYADAVKWAVEKGITNGLTATTFGPNNSCTRGQMVTFLWRAAGSPAATGTNSFSDVASGEYYYNAVLWAVEKGITNGTSATTFSPNATVNRGQTVTFLYRYAESPAATGDTSFTDVTTDAFYADAVKWAVAEEITNGTSSTTFSPASNCTRGQIVTFMYRQMAE